MLLTSADGVTVAGVDALQTAHTHCDRVVGVTMSDTIVGAALSRRPAVYTPQAHPYGGV